MSYDAEQERIFARQRAEDEAVYAKMRAHDERSERRFWWIVAALFVAGLILGPKLWDDYGHQPCDDVAPRGSVAWENCHRLTIPGKE